MLLHCFISVLSLNELLYVAAWLDTEGLSGGGLQTVGGQRDRGEVKGQVHTGVVTAGS